MKQTYYLQGNKTERGANLRTYVSTKVYPGFVVLAEVEAESIREASERFGLTTNEVKT